MKKHRLWRRESQKDNHIIVGTDPMEPLPPLPLSPPLLPPRQSARPLGGIKVHLLDDLRDDILFLLRNRGPAFFKASFCSSNLNFCQHAICPGPDICTQYAQHTACSAPSSPGNNVKQKNMSPVLSEKQLLDSLGPKSVRMFGLPPVYSSEDGEFFVCGGWDPESFTRTLLNRRQPKTATTPGRNPGSSWLQ